jgi:chemotaxis protein CheX
VTGRRSGIVYFTAPKGMLIVMLMKMNESDVCHDNLCDLVGEIANTISGNARRDFGRDFKISPPSIVSGPARQVDMPNGCRPIVVPINWRSHSARLVVCLT